MFTRILDIQRILERKSLFLFGPRQTGKSTFLKHNYSRATVFDLLKPSEYLKFKMHPNQFGEEVEFQLQNKGSKLFIIDEIQKIPELLDETHRLIELHKDIRFILTGSSARKLKKSGINLLGGRAARVNFHPIVSAELGFDSFMNKLVRNLTYGFLPPILNSSEPWEDLEDYVSLYLKEEVQQEAIVRSLGWILSIPRNGSKDKRAAAQLYRSWQRCTGSFADSARILSSPRGHPDRKLIALIY